MKDWKTVMVMSSNCHPNEARTVPRRQQDGSRIPIACPESIIRYNKYMGGVDCGDQLRGYYNCRTKSKKFYKYIYTFLLDVAITNAFILLKYFCPANPFSNHKNFHIRLAKELVTNSVAMEGWSSTPYPTSTFPSRWRMKTTGQSGKGIVVHSMRHHIPVPPLHGAAVNVQFGFTTLTIQQATVS